MDRFKLSWVFVVLITGVLLFSCDLFGDDDDDAFDDWLGKEKGIIIEQGGNSLTYGETYIFPAVGVGDDVTVTVDFTMRNWGQIPISFWGIYDITDRSHLWWHEGAITVDDKEAGAFRLAPEEAQDFSVSFDSTGLGVRDYQIEIGINNKDGLTPNPFVFRVLFTVE